MSQQKYDDNQTTKRIIQYFDDPNNLDALAEVKKLSNMAKEQSSKNINRNFKYMNRDNNSQEKTQRNRLKFKESKNDDYFLNSINRNRHKPNFIRRNHQLQTQTYIPKKKKISLYDEINDQLYGNNKEIKDSKKVNLNNLNFDDNNNEKEKVSSKEIEIKIEKQTIPIIQQKNEDNQTTKRIIQYFDDPNDLDALAEVKKISNMAKEKSSKNIYRNFKYMNSDNNLQNNTERNRSIFKESKNDDYLLNKFNINRQRPNYFLRRKYQQKLQTQTYIPKKKNINLDDEINDQLYGSSNKKINDSDKINLNNHDFDDNDEKEKENQKEEEIEIKIEKQTKPIIQQKNDDNQTTKRIIQYFDNPNDLDALAEVKKISNMAKEQSSKNNINNDNIFQNNIEINRLIFKESKNDDYLLNKTNRNRQKPNFIRRTHHFPTQIYIPQKKDRSLYDEIKEKLYDNNKDKEIKNIETINVDNLYFDDNDEKEKENQKEEEIEIKIEIEIEKQTKPLEEENIQIYDENKNNDNTNDNNTDNKFTETDRVKFENPDEIKNDNDNNNNNNVSYDNKNIKDDFKSSYNPNLMEDFKQKMNNEVIENEKDKDKVVINENYTNDTKKDTKNAGDYPTEYVWDKSINRLVEKKVSFDKSDDNNKNYDNTINNNESNSKNILDNDIDKGKTEDIKNEDKPEVNKVRDKYKTDEEPKRFNRYQRKNKNYNSENNPRKEEVDSKKKTEINNKKPIIEEINTDIMPTYGRARWKYYLSKKKDNKEKEPEKVQKKNIIKEEEKPKVIYTKKIIMEEVLPIKKVDNYKEKENYEEKPKINPNAYNNKNIRINMKTEDFNDEKDNINEQKIKNNPYNNYIKTSNKPKIRTHKKTNDLVDDLEKIENYSVSTYLKNDLLEIYDSINEEFSDFKKDVFYTNINSFEVKMGEFDKKKVPYFKKNPKVDDLCKGRVTTEDMYKKYSENAKKFKREQKYYY